MKLKGTQLIVFIFVLVHCPLGLDAQNDLQIKKNAKIANVSLYVLYPDGGWDFAIIYLSRNWSAAYYVPPERGKEEGKVCDGVIIPNIDSEFELVYDVYQTCAEDQFEEAQLFWRLLADTTELASKFKGRAFIDISPIEGEGKVFERPYNGKFKNSKTQELDEILLSLIKDCKQ